MCGRYILVQQVEALEKRFNAVFDTPELYTPGYNISPGKLAPVITSEHPEKIQLMRFGLTPFWAKKAMYLFNARTEGDNNKENNPNYKGGKGIAQKPAFRKPIRSQRCLVPADAFIEGTTKERLNKPFLVYLKDKVRPFSFAGIWDTWQDPVSNELMHSFAIITTVANMLIQQLPHHRSPVILSPNQEAKWLRQEAPLADVLRLLKPYDSDLMNAYPIAPKIKSPQADGKDLIKPTGQRILPENSFSISKDLRLKGMGNPRKR